MNAAALLEHLTKSQYIESVTERFAGRDALQELVAGGWLTVSHHVVTSEDDCGSDELDDEAVALWREKGIVVHPQYGEEIDQPQVFTQYRVSAALRERRETAKHPRFLYLHEGYDAWVPLDSRDLVGGYFDSLSDGETATIRVKRVDMTNAELAAMPEAG